MQNQDYQDCAPSLGAGAHPSAGGGVKERPMIFSAPMVNALLAGAKTQTRRVVKIRGLDFVGGGPKDGADWNDPSCWGFEDGNTGLQWALANGPCVDGVFACPHGVPGSRLWVRETLRAERYASKRWDSVSYAADNGEIEGVPPEWVPPWRNIRQHQEIGDNIPQGGFAYWTATVPAIFMPRWASRITLEVTDVRVERLWGISRTDVLAEGIVDGAVSAAEGYRALWEHINSKKAPWSSNPWVWVVEFRRITPSSPTKVASAPSPSAQAE